MSTLPVVSITDVPQNKANPIKGSAIVGVPEMKEVANGYISVRVPLHFSPQEGVVAAQLAELSESISGAYENGTVESTMGSLGLRTFTARWLVRPEWFTTEFAQKVKSGQVDAKEVTSYNINMSSLTRGLFAAANRTDINFDTIVGAVVGFSTKPQRDDPSRLDIAKFYPAK